MDNREVKEVQSCQWEEQGCVQTAEIKSTANEEKNKEFAGFLGGLTLLWLFLLKPVFVLFNFTDFLQLKIKLFVKLAEATTDQTQLHAVYQMHCSFFLRTAMILKHQLESQQGLNQKSIGSLTTEYSRTSRCQMQGVQLHLLFSSHYFIFPTIFLEMMPTLAVLTIRTELAAVLANTSAALFIK